MARPERAPHDVDRGAMIAMGEGELKVWMYFDTPGVYYNERGQEVSPSIADIAGIDIEHWGRARARSDASKLLEAEYEDVISAAVSSVEETGPLGFKLVRLNNGMYTIDDPNGTRLFPMPLQADQARRIFSRADPPAKDEEEAVALVFERPKKS